MLIANDDSQPQLSIYLLLEKRLATTILKVFKTAVVIKHSIFIEYTDASIDDLIFSTIVAQVIILISIVYLARDLST